MVLIENAGTSTGYRISPTQNFSSRLRRTPEGQHKPLKPLGLWDPPDRFEDEYRKPSRIGGRASAGACFASRKGNEPQNAQ